MKFHSAAVPVALFRAIPAAVALLGGFIGVRLQMPEASTAQEIPAAQAESTLEGVAEDTEDRAGRDEPGAKDEESAAEVALRAKIDELTLSKGPAHAETLAARRNLADSLRGWGIWGNVQGKLQQEEVERRAILDLMEQAHGKGDPATFEDWQSLAGSYLTQLKHDQAETEYHALITAQTKALGPKHEQTLLTRHAFAQCLFSHRRYAEAEREYRALISIRTLLPGPPESDAAELRATLGLLLEDCGKFEAAEAEHRLCLKALEKAQGPKGAGVLQTRLKIGRCLLRQGKAAQANREFEFVHGVPEVDGVTDITRMETVTRLLEEARQALAESEEEEPAAEAKE